MFPSTTYTPGGPAVSWTVNLPATGGFELTTTAGSLTAGSGTTVSGQYIVDTSQATSWTFQWTPPATAAGSVTVNISGGTHNVNYVGVKQ